MPIWSSDISPTTIQNNHPAPAPSRPPSFRPPAAVRKKHGYLRAQFQRLPARRGPRKAICAVAASIFTAAYHMLKDGPDQFRKTPTNDPRKALARQIERLGFTCSISPQVWRRCYELDGALAF